MKDEGEEREPLSLLVPLERLFDNLEAFLGVTEESMSTKVPSRFIRKVEVTCGFANASGRGLGSTMKRANDGIMCARIGACAAIEEEESSNRGEFSNVVETIESEGMTGRLEKAIVSTFTDNSAVEGAAGKGNVSSKKYFYW